MVKMHFYPHALFVGIQRCVAAVFEVVHFSVRSFGCALFNFGGIALKVNKLKQIYNHKMESFRAKSRKDKIWGIVKRLFVLWLFVSAIVFYCIGVEKAIKNDALQIINVLLAFLGWGSILNGDLDIL